MSGERPLLRSIPRVDELLDRLGSDAELADVPRPILRAHVQAVVEEFRRRVRAGEGPDPSVFFAPEAFRRRVLRRLEEQRRLRHEGVINATGILLHTGLGRAPLSPEARDAAAGMARYGVVEVDPLTGERDRREVRVAERLCALVGAEAATVVNNNAAACLLALAAVARGGEVVVSRGQLVEIGGGFRMPDVMREGGCVLREVGTTNRTHLRDYEKAIGPETRAFLLVHTSNFRIVGFHASPGVSELAALARRRGVPLLFDVGSGLPRPVDHEALADEPDLRGALAQGADLVVASGDKLLGGPQAGLVAGRAPLVERVRRHALFRAVRPDKLALAALEATLAAWEFAPEGPPPLPLYERLFEPLETVRERAEALAASLADAAAGLQVAVRPATGYLGSGAAPARPIESFAVALAPPPERARALRDALRSGRPRVFARLDEDKVWLDLRTVFPDEERSLVEAVTAAWARTRGSP